MSPDVHGRERAGRGSAGHAVRACRSTSVLGALGLERGGRVALSGAGGKSTLAWRLACEGRARGLRTLVSATTRLGATAASAAAVTIEDAAPRAGARAADAAIARLLDAHGCVAVAGPREREDRHAGLPAERVAALGALCDLLIVETDGARGRSLKLPAAHEPVIPHGATLVLVVAGLDVLGRPLDAAHVHRFERVAACLQRDLGRLPGTPIDEEALAAVLLDADGYLARAPLGARAAVFLNTHDDGAAGEAHATRWLASRLLARYDAVACGAARGGPVQAWHRAPL